MTYTTIIFGPFRPISSLVADGATYPRVMFDRSPSSRVTTRGRRAEWSREEGPPELLLHPNRLVCFGIWGRQEFDRWNKAAERSKQGGNRRWDRKEKKEKFGARCFSFVFNSLVCSTELQPLALSFLCNRQNLNHLCKTYIHSYAPLCRVTPEVLEAFTSHFYLSLANYCCKWSQF